MQVKLDSEAELLELSHPDAKQRFVYPIVYLPELLEGLETENSEITFFHQNFGIERTKKSVRIIKSVGKYITLLELTPKQAGKLANALRTSFEAYL